jgi:mannose-1-phosphate guanylyltransferase
MKAFLLAAGRGERLRPLTDRVPKCLVPIGGTPLLGLWLHRLRQHGADAVLINTHYLADQVQAYLRDHPVAGLDVRTVHEPQLPGSAGTVLRNREFVAGEESFLIVYADNLTDMDVGDFWRFHQARDGLLTMGVFETPAPREGGIVLWDERGRVTAFEEKPAHPRSAWANAGIYAARSGLLERIPRNVPCDFGHDVLPLLVGEMYSYPIRGFFCDIGTPERLAAARRAWDQAGGISRGGAESAEEDREEDLSRRRGERGGR